MRALLLLGLVAGMARGESTLRIATLTPDGTSWARELRGWAEKVERVTQGAAKIKLYFGGLAGDEPAVLERIKRGQLDGTISVGTFCQELMPSIRVMKVPGLFQSRDEASFVMNRLKPTLDQEALANGFVNLAEGSVGSVVFFLKKPARTMSELRQLRLWAGMDEVSSKQLAGLGLQIGLQRMGEVSSLVAAGALDGALTTPSVALAFQWSHELRWFLDLRVSLIFSCLMVTRASFEALPVEAQRGLRAAVAELQVRTEQLNREQDDALIAKVFPKQGLTQIPVDERLRFEFFEAARSVREKIAPTLMPAALIQQVLSLLAGYRAENPQRR